MAHFAKVLDGKVVKVIVAEQEFFNTFIDDSPGQWIQTSYNTYGSKHYNLETGELSEDQSKVLRGNFASIGYTYDATNDVFYAPKPFNSWVLNESTWTWEAPIVMPDDGKSYIWNEAIINWKETTT